MKAAHAAPQMTYICGALQSKCTLYGVLHILSHWRYIPGKDSQLVCIDIARLGHASCKIAKGLVM